MVQVEGRWKTWMHCRGQETQARVAQEQGRSKTWMQCQVQVARGQVQARVAQVEQVPWILGCLQEGRARYTGRQVYGKHALASWNYQLATIGCRQGSNVLNFAGGQP